MTTEELIIKDEAAESRAWKAAQSVDDCSSGRCIHSQTPEKVFRRGFRYGLAQGGSPAWKRKEKV